MDQGSFSRDTASIIHGQRFSGHRNRPGPPTTSFLWVSIILHAIGDPAWAEKYVQTLPSQEDMQSDGATGQCSLEELVRDVRAAIWENGDECIHLNTDDITERRGCVYFTKAYQDKLIQCLQDKRSYAWVAAWIQTRYNTGVSRAQVHFPMHYGASSQYSAARPAAMLSCTLLAPVPYSLCTCGLQAVGAGAGNRASSEVGAVPAPRRSERHNQQVHYPMH